MVLSSKWLLRWIHIACCFFVVVSKFGVYNFNLVERDFFGLARRKDPRQANYFENSKLALARIAADLLVAVGGFVTTTLALHRCPHFAVPRQVSPSHLLCVQYCASIRQITWFELIKATQDQIVVLFPTIL